MSERLELVTMYGRKAQSLGTKTSASSWQLTLTGTVSA